ncbi:hypothetical protein E6O75_ATG01758 [Venturia nashicola]|uniref:Uncharacterized protein n=1 Tax=Venturia nashicola TaxID=86259 RepID=A0A4Z1NS81_9PEZI|nr:hypothetical protein E6O75_ATG01758 [Venturia nashicola]
MGRKSLVFKKKQSARSAAWMKQQNENYYYGQHEEKERNGRAQAESGDVVGFNGALRRKFEGGAGQRNASRRGWRNPVHSILDHC